MDCECKAWIKVDSLERRMPLNWMIWLHDPSLSWVWNGYFAASRVCLPKESRVFPQNEISILCKVIWLTLRCRLLDLLWCLTCPGCLQLHQSAWQAASAADQHGRPFGDWRLNRVEWDAQSCTLYLRTKHVSMVNIWDLESHWCWSVFCRSCLCTRVESRFWAPGTRPPSEPRDRSLGHTRISSARLRNDDILDQRPKDHVEKNHGAWEGWTWWAKLAPELVGWWLVLCGGLAQYWFRMFLFKHRNRPWSPSHLFCLRCGGGLEVRRWEFHEVWIRSWATVQLRNAGVLQEVTGLNLCCSKGVWQPELQASFHPNMTDTDVL